MPPCAELGHVCGHSLQGVADGVVQTLECCGQDNETICQLFEYGLVDGGTTSVSVCTGLPPPSTPQPSPPPSPPPSTPPPDRPPDRPPLPPGETPRPPPPSTPPNIPPPLPATPPTLERAIETEITVSVDADDAQEIDIEDLIIELISDVADKIPSYGYPNSTITLLNAFGLNPTDEQLALIEFFTQRHMRRSLNVAREARRVKRRERRLDALEARHATTWSEWMAGLWRRARRSLQSDDDDAAPEVCTKSSNVSLELTLYPRAGEDVQSYIDVIDNWYREQTIVIPCANASIVETMQEVVIDVPSPRIPPPVPPPMPPPFPPSPTSPPKVSGSVQWWVVPLIASLALISCCGLGLWCCFPVAAPDTDCEKIPIWLHDPQHGDWLVDRVPAKRLPERLAPRRYPNHPSAL